LAVFFAFFKPWVSGCRGGKKHPKVIKKTRKNIRKYFVNSSDMFMYHEKTDAFPVYNDKPPENKKSCARSGLLAKGIAGEV
jgi:hypothetical protein